MKDNFESALWLMNADGTKQRFLVKGGNAVWSPDGSRIAYLAEGEPGGAQVWVRYMDAEGSTLQVTRLQRRAGEHQVVARRQVDRVQRVRAGRRELAHRHAGRADRARSGPRRRGSSGSFMYRADRTGYLDDGYTHLFVVPATGGTPRQITKGEWNVGGRGATGFRAASDCDWTPDGRTIVFEGNDDPKAEMCYRCANIYAVDVASGAMRRLTPDVGLVVESRASRPDGRTIAFTGAPASDDSYRALTLFTMSIDGSGPRGGDPGARP